MNLDSLVVGTALPEYAARATMPGDPSENKIHGKSLFERKGHEFVELDLLLVAEGARPVASIRHIATCQLRGAA